MENKLEYYTKWRKHLQTLTAMFLEMGNLEESKYWFEQSLYVRELEAKLNK